MTRNDPMTQCQPHSKIPQLVWQVRQRPSSPDYGAPCVFPLLRTSHESKAWSLLHAVSPKWCPQRNTLQHERPPAVWMITQHGQKHVIIMIIVHPKTQNETLGFEGKRWVESHKNKNERAKHGRAILYNSLSNLEPHTVYLCSSRCILYVQNGVWGAGRFPWSNRTGLWHPVKHWNCSWTATPSVDMVSKEDQPKQPASASQWILKDDGVWVSKCSDITSDPFPDSSACWWRHWPVPPCWHESGSSKQLSSQAWKGWWRLGLREGEVVTGSDPAHLCHE